MKLKITLSLDPFEYDLLREMARRDDRSLSYVVGRCIERVAYGKIVEAETLTLTPAIEQIERKHGLRDPTEGKAV